MHPVRKARRPGQLELAPQGRRGPVHPQTAIRRALVDGRYRLAHVGVPRRVAFHHRRHAHQRRKGEPTRPLPHDRRRRQHPYSCVITQDRLFVLGGCQRQYARQLPVYRRHPRIVRLGDLRHPRRHRRQIVQLQRLCRLLRADALGHHQRVVRHIRQRRAQLLQDATHNRYICHVPLQRPPRLAIRRQHPAPWRLARAQPAEELPQLSIRA